MTEEKDFEQMQAFVDSVSDCLNTLAGSVAAFQSLGEVEPSEARQMVLGAKCYFLREILAVMLCGLAPAWWRWPSAFRWMARRVPQAAVLGPLYPWLMGEPAEA